MNKIVKDRDRILAADVDFAVFLALVSARPPREEAVVWTTQRLANYLYDEETERLLPIARYAEPLTRRPRKHHFTEKQMEIALRVLDNQQKAANK
jgi:hypothetical protein